MSLGNHWPEGLDEGTAVEPEVCLSCLDTGYSQESLMGQAKVRVACPVRSCRLGKDVRKSLWESRGETRARSHKREVSEGSIMGQRSAWYVHLRRDHGNEFGDKVHGEGRSEGEQGYVIPWDLGQGVKGTSVVSVWRELYGLGYTPFASCCTCQAEARRRNAMLSMAKDRRKVYNLCASAMGRDPLPPIGGRPLEHAEAEERDPDGIPYEGLALAPKVDREVYNFFYGLSISLIDAMAKARRLELEREAKASIERSKAVSSAQDYSRTWGTAWGEGFHALALAIRRVLVDAKASTP